MPVKSILCPVDFSEPSRSALAYAAAAADHLAARLTVLTVDDPLLAEAAAVAGIAPSLADDTRHELLRFCGDVLGNRPASANAIDYVVTTGKPAIEILRLARDRGVDLIVISSHGRSGMRRMFFGSTTERVLRETQVPVLITSGQPAPVTTPAEIARRIHRVLAPVDLSPASRYHIEVAHGIASSLSVPLIVSHVVEPVFVPSGVRIAMRGVEDARREEARERLAAIVRPIDPRAELMVLTGDPSEEINALSEARSANLIVMALHSSGLLGPRMGSVTYRVLCLTHALILALPPSEVQAPARTEGRYREPAAVTHIGAGTGV